VGSVARVRVIGALIIEDEEGPDPKILSVLDDDARFHGVRDITDIHKHELVEIAEFFETYKRLEPLKWVKVKCWKSAEEAKEIVMSAIQKYKELSF
jgi:inorganic pyrophosphatase